MKRFLAMFVLTTSEQRVVVFLVLGLVAAALLGRCDRAEDARAKPTAGAPAETR